MNGRKRFSRLSSGDSLFSRIIIHLVLIIACGVSIYPIIRILSISLRPGDKVLSTSFRIIPPDATWSNYIYALFKTDFFLWLINSLLVAASASIIGVILAISAAYSFSRFRFPGRKAGLTFLLITQMAPATMLLLPLFIMLSRLHLMDNFSGLLIAYAVTSLPFSIWILKGYFDTIPVDLEDAAKIDGCTQIGAFLRVILPLSTPAIAIAGLFNFMTAWNEYIVARVIIQNPKLFTWTIGLTQYFGSMDAKWGLFAASAVVVSLPVMIIFLFSSRWLISGMTLGGLKE